MTGSDRVTGAGGPIATTRTRILGIGLAIAFVVLAVLARRTPYFTFDLTVTRAVQSVDAGWLDGPLGVLNRLGFPPLVDIVAAAIVVALFVMGWRWSATCAAFAAVGIAVLNFAVKACVDRPRPSSQLVHVEHHLPGSGFPAGHVMTFAAFFGFLCYLAYVYLRPLWLRATVVTVLATTIVLMGVARIHAGEHWPSDVLGGYLLGSLWLLVTTQVFRRDSGRFVHDRDPRNGRPARV